MADGRDKGGLVPAGTLQRVLIALTLGNIAPEAHQPVAFTDAVIIGNFADFEAGFAPVGVIEPLLIGERDIVTKHFLVGLNHFLRRFRRVNILRFEVNQLLFTFAGEQLHRAVAAGKLFIFIAIEDQIGRSIKERAQERGLLFELDLRLLTLLHLNLQPLKRCLSLRFGFFAIADLLVKLHDVVFKLHVELKIALAHLFQLLHQPR